MFTSSKSVVVVCIGLLWLLAAPPSSQAAGTTTTTLVSAPSGSSIFGRQVTLTTTVNPSTATGLVTFYEGTTVLGEAAVNAGRAVLSTFALPTGMRSLRAFYSADVANLVSTSARRAVRLRSDLLA